MAFIEGITDFIKDKDTGEILFPKTTMRAVTNEEGKSVDNVLSEINSTLVELVKVISIAFPSTGNVSANSNATVSTNINDRVPSGYKPILISAGYTGDDQFVWVSCSLSSDGSAIATIRNASSSADSGTPTASILCVKEI